MKYAVTAATGHFGRVAVKQLTNLVGKEQVVAIVRNVAKGEEILPAGVEIRQGDYTDPAGMQEALAGIDRLLFISSQPGGAVNREIQHCNVVKAAKAAGVSLVAYTSYPNADQATAPLAHDHQATEEALKKSGLAHVFLRDNWYLENDLSFLLAGQAGQPAIYWTDGKAAWAPEALYATATAKVLITSAPKEVYEFGGQPVSYKELGAALEEALGKKVKITKLSRPEYEAALVASGMDEQTASQFASFEEPHQHGDLDVSSNDLATVLGYPLPSLVESIKQLLNN
jgi:NAD(P)H dehydrogenase (quinone)